MPESAMPRNEIPRHYHFLFGLRPQEEPFHLMHYLCLKSCINVNQPDRITLYYHHEPFGPWWQRIKPELELEHIALEDFVSGHPGYAASTEGRFIVQHRLQYAHQADFLRLRLLLDRGGVYADMDTLFVQPLPDRLFEADFVLGSEGTVSRGDGETVDSLCNALILSRADARFGRAWLEQMYEVFDGTWNRHSCLEAAYLSQRLPSELQICPERYFFKHRFTPEGIYTLFEDRDDDIEDVFSMHLWSHLWWSPHRRDFSDFHAGLLTEDYVRYTDTTYSRLARVHLE